jgi:hypothetical protein
MRQKRAGFTMIEAVLGIAAAAIIGVVTAMLFKMTILSYVSSTKRNAALQSAARALDMPGSRSGMVFALQSGAAVTGLAASSFTVVSTGSIATSYYLNGSNLMRSYNGGGAATQAGPFQSMALNYYNINAGTGLIMTSTSGATATLVTMTLVVSGASAPTPKTYTFFSSAALRNHP